MNTAAMQVIMREEMERLRTKDEMLETLRRLKQQTEAAITCVEADQIKQDPRVHLAPGMFRIGDFAVCDRTKLFRNEPR